MTDTPTPFDVLLHNGDFLTDMLHGNPERWEIGVRKIFTALEAAGYRIVREPTEEMLDAMEHDIDLSKELREDLRNYGHLRAAGRSLIAAAPTYGENKER